MWVLRGCHYIDGRPTSKSCYSSFLRISRVDLKGAVPGMGSTWAPVPKEYLQDEPVLHSSIIAVCKAAPCGHRKYTGGTACKALCMVY